jgi:hypothetical protein
METKMEIKKVSTVRFIIEMHNRNQANVTLSVQSTCGIRPTTVTGIILAWTQNCKYARIPVVSKELPDVIVFQEYYDVQAEYILVETSKPSPPYKNLSQMCDRYNELASRHDLPLIDKDNELHRPYVFFPYRTLFWFCTRIEEAKPNALIPLPDITIRPKTDELTARIFLRRALFRFRDDSPPVAYPVDGGTQEDVFNVVITPAYCEYVLIPSIDVKTGKRAFVNGKTFPIYSLQYIYEHPEFLYYYLPKRIWMKIWNEIKDVYEITENE